MGATAACWENIWTFGTEPAAERFRVDVHYRQSDSELLAKSLAESAEASLYWVKNGLYLDVGSYCIPVQECCFAVRQLLPASHNRFELACFLEKQANPYLMAIEQGRSNDWHTLCLSLGELRHHPQFQSFSLIAGHFHLFRRSGEKHA
ncbi:hypothetical protein BIY29_08575 [Brenneria alni]|uniref:Uncharacterized protein n=1 Tax=Brenneria alni TaxID=71656 RepID=A0A421DPE4_9GAMM|nr:hypothetical protein [Brenneria alni]RLM24761.1 hypothetical protein BIY29_08575 [Brenneria alni]